MIKDYDDIDLENDYDDIIFNFKYNQDRSRDITLKDLIHFFEIYGYYNDNIEYNEIMEYAAKSYNKDEALKMVIFLLERTQAEISYLYENYDIMLEGIHNNIIEYLCNVNNTFLMKYKYFIFFYLVSPKIYKEISNNFFPDSDKKKNIKRFIINTKEDKK